MITIKNMTIKNFLSIGNVTQVIDFDRQDLTLILGENLDQGGNGSRNGCGKSSIMNALSYVLYGNALSNIKLNNLINKTNEKNMMVSVDFLVDGVEYRIERGRKPNILKFLKIILNMIMMLGVKCVIHNKKSMKYLIFLMICSNILFR